MNLQIQHQEKYSRLELLLRTFFGALYIGIPHLFLLFFISIAYGFMSFITFWAILFTGKFPRFCFDFILKYMRWQLRVAASMSNMSDGYPPLGMDAVWPPVTLDIEYPEQSSRGGLLLRAFLGAIYIALPHGFCLAFRFIGQAVVNFLAFWAILFSGRSPAGMHAYSVGTYRWIYRIQAYYLMMTDTYPPFSGKE